MEQVVGFQRRKVILDFKCPNESVARWLELKDKWETCVNVFRRQIVHFKKKILLGVLIRSAP